MPLPSASPSQLAAARDLVIASGLSRTFQAIIPQIMQQINMTLTRTRPELLTPLKESLDRLQPDLEKLADPMIDNAARVYTALLTEQECKDATAFFRSAVGKKYVDAQPSLIINMAQGGEEWSRQTAAVILDRVRADMKKKGYDM